MARDGGGVLDSAEARAARLAELKVERKSIDGEIARIEAARWQRVEQVDSRREAAMALIEGKAAGAELHDLDRQLRDLRTRRTVLDDALEMLAPVVATDRARAGTAITRRLRPEHKDAVRAVAHALFALAAANEAEARIRSQVPGSAGAKLPHLGWPGIGSPRDLGSPLKTWLRAAQDSNTLTSEEIRAMRDEAGL